MPCDKPFGLGHIASEIWEVREKVRKAPGEVLCAVLDLCKSIENETPELLRKEQEVVFLVAALVDRVEELEGAIRRAAAFLRQAATEAKRAAEDLSWYLGPEGKEDEHGLA